jgi:hypothetical protein
MSNRRGFRTASNSYGQFWFGGNSFPGFLYKKNIGSGTRRSTLFTPGGTTISNQPNEFWNKYTPGSGVGASSIATRRAKMIQATSCSAGQKCGRFYAELGQNQIRPSRYTNPGSNLSVYPPVPKFYKTTPVPNNSYEILEEELLVTPQYIHIPGFELIIPI